VRNTLNSTHNPKVLGSNPSPATINKNKGLDDKSNPLFFGQKTSYPTLFPTKPKKNLFDRLPQEKTLGKGRVKILEKGKARPFGCYPTLTRRRSLENRPCVMPLEGDFEDN
jgi:hypothetical protein